MIRINEILDKVSSYLPAEDLELISRAYVFSASAHAKQTRRSGEPYLSHPLEAANILAELRLDGVSIAAGLLHDTVEDTITTIEEIEELFGEEIAGIVDGVTKVNQRVTAESTSKADIQAENIRKIVMATTKNIRVILVKLADRLHNMRTLEFQRPLNRFSTANETLEIYAPLANRLGLHQIKTELEDLCIKHLKPEIYKQITEGIAAHKAQGKDYIEEVSSILRTLLYKNNIKGRVFGRNKHVYSIYHKTINQNISLEDVHDLTAFRILVGTLSECYATLGKVHSLWKPIPGRFKDYISMPKGNMYQSLHTTVIGPKGLRIEIQIRTEEMDHMAEYGVAAHWGYKKEDKQPLDKEETWLKQIVEWQREYPDSRDFIDTLRQELVEEEVFAFTPKGQIKSLPKGATPVDMAYAIHTEIGDHCVGAKVNGGVVPLSSPLPSGASVEILTDESSSPKIEWLDFVKTARARTRIKNRVEAEKRALHIALGKELLSSECARHDIDLDLTIEEGGLLSSAWRFSYQTEEDLLVAIGSARLTPRKAMRPLLGLQKNPPTFDNGRRKVLKPSPIRIHRKDQENLSSIAECCLPLPGEPIVGVLNKEKGLIIHAVNCPELLETPKSTHRSVNWEEKEKQSPHAARIHIVTLNKDSILGHISTELEHSFNKILSGSFTLRIDGYKDFIFKVEVSDASQLYSGLEKLRLVSGVIEASRIDNIKNVPFSNFS